MGNGALPNGPSYRAHPRLYRLGPKAVGRACLLCPGISDINLLGYGKSVVHLDAEVTHRALDFRVSQ